MQLEAEKNKLENLLTNNLVRRKDELVQALQEISVEDRQRQLDSSNNQLADIEKRLMKVNEDFKSQNEKVTSAMKKVSLQTFFCNCLCAFKRKQSLIYTVVCV